MEAICLQRVCLPFGYPSDNLLIVLIVHFYGPPFNQFNDGLSILGYGRTVKRKEKEKEREEGKGRSVEIERRSSGKIFQIFNPGGGTKLQTTQFKQLECEVTEKKRTITKCLTFIHNSRLLQDLLNLGKSSTIKNVLCVTSEYSAACIGGERIEVPLDTSLK